jgi:hypothetical protein
MKVIEKREILIFLKDKYTLVRPLLFFLKKSKKKINAHPPDQAFHTDSTPSYPFPYHFLAA